MSKPDDIPQDVWDAGNDTWMRAGAHSLIDQQVEVIARAILAERERCIRVAATVANEGGDAGTCLSIAEELRCPDIETKRAALK